MTDFPTADPIEKESKRSAPKGVRGEERVMEESIATNKIEVKPNRPAPVGIAEGRRGGKRGPLYFLRYIPMGLIRLYQKTLSPDHSPLMLRLLSHGVCRFYPTCSEYTYQAIEKYGITKGSWLGLKRIVRCNPFNPGGIDPVP